MRPRRLDGVEMTRVEEYLTTLDSENIEEFEALIMFLARDRDDPLMEDLLQLIRREVSGRFQKRGSFS
jgi:hypothetical protein